MFCFNIHNLPVSNSATFGFTFIFLSFLVKKNRQLLVYYSKQHTNIASSLLLFLAMTLFYEEYEMKIFRVYVCF